MQIRSIDHHGLFSFLGQFFSVKSKKPIKTYVLLCGESPADCGRCCCCSPHYYQYHNTGSELACVVPSTAECDRVTRQEVMPKTCGPSL